MLQSDRRRGHGHRPRAGAAVPTLIRAVAVTTAIAWSSGPGPIVPAAHADVEYDLIVVEAFDGSIPECYLWDINDSNRACGTSTSGSFYAGFQWTEAEGKSATPLIWIEDINDLDQVAGDAALHDLTTGETTFIGGLGGGFTTVYVHGLNDTGLVVGHVKGSGSDSDGVNRTPIVWDAESGTRGIDVLASRELLRVNDAGVAVGNIRWSAGDSEAFVYDVPTGDAVLLHELLSPSGAGTSSAAGINENGVVLGSGWNGSAFHAFTWTEAAGFTFLPGLDGGASLRVNPAAINDAEVVVGSAMSGVTGDWRAFAWDPVRGMRDLNDAIDPSSGFVLDRALGINNLGWIVGDGHMGPGFGAPRGFVLIPRDVVSTPDLAGRPMVPRLRLAPGSATVSRGPFALTFDLAVPGSVQVDVIDVSGRRVASLASGYHSGGVHRIEWSGADDAGRIVSSGVYHVRLTATGSAGVAGTSVARVVRIR